MSKLPTLQKIQFESNQWTVYFMELFFIVVRLKQMVVIVKRKRFEIIWNIQFQKRKRRILTLNPSMPVLITTRELRTKKDAFLSVFKKEKN